MTYLRAFARGGLHGAAALFGITVTLTVMDWIREWRRT